MTPSEKAIAQGVINSLYNSIKSSGVQMPPEIKRVFSDHYSRLRGEEDLPHTLPATEGENRSFGRGMIAGAIITLFVAMVIGLSIFLSYRAAEAPPPKDYLPPVARVVIDSAEARGWPKGSIIYIGSLGEILDSIRQASPALQHLYDSKRVERREGHN